MAKGGAGSGIDIEIRGSLSSGEKKRRVDTGGDSKRQSQGEADGPSAESLRSQRTI